jgi:hypothetical protein
VNRPRHAGEILDIVLKEVGSRAGRERFRRVLEAAVGSEVAAHLAVLGFRAGRLYVAVDSAPLFAELRGFQRESIRQACNEQLVSEQIGEIVFRVGGTGHV